MQQKDDEDLPLVLDWENVNESTPVPKYVQKIMEGVREPFTVDDYSSSNKDWIDLDLFHQGQKILTGCKAQIVLLHVQVMGTLSPFIPSMHRLLMRDGRCPDNTPGYVLKHARSICVGLWEWFTTDFFVGKPDRVIRKALYIHKHYYDRFKKNKAWYDRKFILDENLDDLSDEEARYVRMFQLAEQDFGKQIKAPMLAADPPENPSAVYLNQVDGMLCQAIVLAVLLSRAEQIGLGTVEKRRTLIYFARVLLYCFGLKDEYNLAIGSVKEVQQNVRDVMLFVMGPMIRSPTLEMRRHLCVYYNESFSRWRVPRFGAWWLCTAARFLQLDEPASLWKEAPWSDRMVYYVLSFVEYILRKSSVARKIADAVVARLVAYAAPDILRK